ncbi:unnamed protein product [Camellia sinensis]
MGCQDEEDGVKVDPIEIARLRHAARSPSPRRRGRLERGGRPLRIHGNPPSRASGKDKSNGESRVSFLKKEFLRSNPVEYSSELNPMKVDKWLEEIVKSFEILDINDGELRVALAVYQLKREAGQWWKTVKHRVEHTWEAFVHAFQENFLPLTTRERLRKQFEELRQLDTPVAEFEAMFTSLARFAPKLIATEEHRCFKFEKRFKA